MQQQWDIRTHNVKLCKSSFITYFYCHTEFLIHIIGVGQPFGRSVGHLATRLWLSVSSFHIARFVCLPLFFTIFFYYYMHVLFLTREKKSVLIILWKCICPVGLVDKEITHRAGKNRFYRVCWCRIKAKTQPILICRAFVYVCVRSHFFLSTILLLLFASLSGM